MRSIFVTGVVVSLAGIGCASQHAAKQETAQQQQAQHGQAQAQGAPQARSQPIIITFTPKEGTTEEEKEQMSERERALRESGVGDVRRTEEAVILTVNGGVLFAFNKDTLLPEAQQGLDKVAKVITQMPTSEPLRIEGYTDSVGTEDYNQDLSERRASAVSDYLVSRGVSPDQITSEGFGEENPVATNETPEGRANNRRVEIVLPETEVGVGGSGQAGQPCPEQPSAPPEE